MTTPLHAPSLHALRDQARAAAARTRAWLLQGPTQLTRGPQAGGVAGEVDADGQPRYVYGEITGYWLHWLAGLAAVTDVPWARRQQAAAAASDWATRTYAAGLPVPTRIALRADAAPDWRNTVEFCFDLAMLVGGLSAAASADLIAPPRDLLQALLQRLRVCAAGDHLQPLLAGADATAVQVPVRWSTTPGPFLLKAAARIRRAATWVPLPVDLEPACGNAGPQALAVLRTQAYPLHPSLYALEGAWALGVAPESVRAPLQALLDLRDAAGWLPELPGQGAAVRRSDIQAQALRLLIGTRLPAEAPHPGEAELVRALLHCVQADGRVVFVPTVAAPSSSSAPTSVAVAAPVTQAGNVWCAMFAEQALRIWADPELPLSAEDLV